jgi:hypothetical protein
MGRVSKTRIGLTNPFRMARTMAMEIASVNTPLEPSVVIVIPGMIHAIKSSDRPSTTVKISKRMSDWMKFLIYPFDLRFSEVALQLHYLTYYGRFGKQCHYMCLPK